MAVVVPKPLFTQTDAKGASLLRASGQRQIIWFRVREPRDIMSALEGEGGYGKADVVREFV